MSDTTTIMEGESALDDGGIAALQPLDEHNQEWRGYTHPPDWQNPTPDGRYNMVVIGAGPAGLVAAAAAAGMGGKVALIEKGLLGGDCLNVGCVPSKALIRCARAAADARNAEAYGVEAGRVEVDFPAVMTRLRRLRAQLSAHDSASRLQDLGVDVYLGAASFSGPNTVTVEGQELTFSRALISTGARAAAPPIPGLEDAGYLTNETLFSLTELPPRFAIIGAGPIGCEMAQSFARFGSEVTLVESGDRILPREDPDAAAIVEEALRRDGVNLICGGKTLEVGHEEEQKILRLQCGEHEHDIHVDEILVGVGRAPNVEELNLEAAGVEYASRKGVQVDDRFRTSNKRIYAAGDVASKYKFTHAADAMARIVLRNALFFGRTKGSALTIPWCTFTDPEIAHVGVNAETAAQEGVEVETLTIPLEEVDRAVLDGDDTGFLRVYLKKGSDQIAGATLVARHAGEMISEITAVMAAGKGLGTLANTIHPYPTQAEVIKKAADAYSRTRLTPRVKSMFKTLLSWRR